MTKNKNLEKKRIQLEFRRPKYNIVNAKTKFKIIAYIQFWNYKKPNQLFKKN